MDKKLKVLMSGGGTGGHIFPAVAIAQEIQSRFPDAEILFIGAKGKMEMEKVPQAGFRIVGLDIVSFNRGSLLSNLNLPVKIVRSLWKARKLIREFNPDLAIGTGGFASGPALYAATRQGVPIFVQEQNSLPGKTNTFLSEKAKAVFTAYPDMQKFFKGAKTFFLGNPVREAILTGLLEKEQAREKMGLDKNMLTILSVGGSLGSKTLNNGWLENLNRLNEKGYQLIWQTGKTEYASIMQKVSDMAAGSDHLQIKEFIADMAMAYSAADVIVSRAGAIAISELAIAGKPVLLVPFPFAAEDHQTENAQTLVKKKAAKMVKDMEMNEKFWNTLSEICESETLRAEMSANICFFAKPEATKEIVDEILKAFHIKEKKQA